MGFHGKGERQVFWVLGFNDGFVFFEHLVVKVERVFQRGVLVEIAADWAEDFGRFKASRPCMYKFGRRCVNAIPDDSITCLTTA
jgi:hypothetical protein